MHLSIDYVYIFLESQTCGLIAVLGQANAGKSTLINALVGQKVSIVSPKAHTTRYEIYGIVCHNQSQMIFLDTPGLLEQPKGKLQTLMAHTTDFASRKADLSLVVIDACTAWRQSVDKLIQTLTHQTFSIVLNKIDQVQKPKLLELASHYSAYTASIFMVSAKKGDGLSDLLDYVQKEIPKGPWLFPECDLTQISERFWAEEITREKLFICVHQEIPYQAHIRTEQWIEKPKHLILKQCILVSKESHRKFVLGYKGCRIAAIGLRARLEMEKYFQKKVHLFLYVKVDPQWVREL